MKECTDCKSRVACSLDDFRVCIERKLPIQPTIENIMKGRKPVFTNDLKKGIYVRQSNGWDARIEDNLKGNTRLATVWGFETEMGSIYSHDITYAYVGSQGKSIEEARQCPIEPVQHTEDQLRLKKKVNSMGW